MKAYMKASLVAVVVVVAVEPSSSFVELVVELVAWVDYSMKIGRIGLGIQLQRRVPELD